MTDTPSDAAIEEALRRANDGYSSVVADIRKAAARPDHVGYRAARAVLAHAKTLQEVDRVARAAAQHAGRFDQFNQRYVDALRSLMLPDSVDPDEELARAFHDAYESLAPSFGYVTREGTRIFDPQSPNGKLMLATIKRLRADGRLTDAK